jgi:hypothetical protein
MSLFVAALAAGSPAWAYDDGNGKRWRALGDTTA